MPEYNKLFHLLFLFNNIHNYILILTSNIVLDFNIFVILIKVQNILCA